jgi:hypothetical protein
MNGDNESGAYGSAVFNLGGNGSVQSSSKASASSDLLATISYLGTDAWYHATLRIKPDSTGGRNLRLLIQTVASDSSYQGDGDAGFRLRNMRIDLVGPH